MSNKSWDIPTRNNNVEDDDQTPKHVKKAKKKPYGIEYFRGYSLGGWTSHSWYATIKARDQAYNKLVSKADSLPSGARYEIRKVERTKEKNNDTRS